MANQLRDLEHRDGMLTDIMTRTCDGQAAGECQGRVRGGWGVTLASSSSRMLPSLNFLSVRISRDIFSTFSLILEAVSSFSALTAVAYLAGESPESGSISENSRSLTCKKAQASNSSQYIAQST